MSGAKRIAVVLFQLGGPDSQAAVEPFLYNLFCDPDIINFPGAFLARKALAKLISTTRSKVASCSLLLPFTRPCRGLPFATTMPRPVARGNAGGGG